MGHTVRLRGAFWPQDHWGRVTNAAIARDQIAQPALEAADEVADAALERFGEQLHSVYLSGPAARGRPGGVAVFVLLRMGASHTRGVADGWEHALAAQLRRRHPRVGRIAIAVFSWKDVFTTDAAFSPARFRLAVNAVCVAGRNMTRMLAPQRLDAAVMNGDILNFRPRMLNAAGRLGAAKSPDRVRAAAMDAGHAVLAAGFASMFKPHGVTEAGAQPQQDAVAAAAVEGHPPAAVDDHLRGGVGVDLVDRAGCGVGCRCDAHERAARR